MKAQYSIRDIEKLTGVKAHTLRIWEQRYGMVVPHRTDTNIRFYDDDQLKTLINISVLLKNGKKISKVAIMNNETMMKELIRISTDTQDLNFFYEIQIDSLVIAMVDLDEAQFEKIFSVCVLRYGFQETMVKVIIPFLGKVGVLWSIGEVNVAQEHFISNLIRRKLVAAIEELKGKQQSDDKYLLFLPEGEYHEIGLLLAEYIIRLHGHRIIYLGQSLPYTNLVTLCDSYQPTYLLTYFTSGFQRISIEEYVSNIVDQISCKQILICGPRAKQATHKKLPGNVKFLEQVSDLITHISSKTPV